jgi:hypothetical protein
VSLSIAYPPLIRHRKYIRNGMYPTTQFYAQAVTAENHITAFRKKCLFERRLFLGNTATSGSDARYRFHTGYGTTKLIAHVLLCRAAPSTVGTNDDPTLALSVTIPGGATTSFDSAHAGSNETAITDAPNEFSVWRGEIAVDPNTTYTGLITGTLGYRVAGITIYEESDGALDSSVNYYNSMTPSSGLKVFDAHRQRLLQGLSNMWGKNGGLHVDWSLENAASRVRTSATFINLIDNTETGTPTANSAGWTLDLGSRTTVSRIVVPCVLAVYGSVAGGGSGTVRLIDTGGATLGSITINSATPQWWTATANLVASVGKFYAPQLASDGVNSLSVSALSLYEYE